MMRMREGRGVAEAWCRVCVGGCPCPAECVWAWPAARDWPVVWIWDRGTSGEPRGTRRCMLMLLLRPLLRLSLKR